MQGSRAGTQNAATYPQFDSAVDDHFLYHSDLTPKLENLIAGRSHRLAASAGLSGASDPIASRLHRPHPRPCDDNGSEITLACDMSFASREKAIISQWEVGVGMVAGGGPHGSASPTHRPKPRPRGALELGRNQSRPAEAYGCINRALPDADLDGFVEPLATRIAKFDKWAIANTKRLVNTSLPPDVEIGAGCHACIGSLGRPAAQNAASPAGESGKYRRVPPQGSTDGCLGRTSVRASTGSRRADRC